MLFYCIAVGGMLISMQYRCQKKFEEAQRPTFEELEELFEIENRMLDLEIAGLLDHHRALVSRSGIPVELYVTSDLERKFDELERRLKNG